MVIGKKTKPAAAVSSAPEVVIVHQDDNNDMVERIVSGKLTLGAHCAKNNLKEINHEEMIKAAIAKEHFYDEFKFASKQLKMNRQFVCECLAINGGILKYLSKEFKNDEDLVLIAVKCYGWALAFASDSLRNNKKVLETAIRSKSGSLCFAGASLRNEEEIAKLSCKIDEKSFDLLGYEFKEDFTKMRHLYEIITKLKEDNESFTDLTIKLAVDSYIKNNYTDALRILSQSLGSLQSNRNYPFALRILGEIYELGKGSHKNSMISKFYYKKAAEMNEPFSMFKISKIFQQEENTEQALEYMKKSAEIGYPPAMMCAAEMLARENSELAMNYCNNAVNCGYPDAIFLQAKLKLNLGELESIQHKFKDNFYFYGWTLGDEEVDHQILELAHRAAEKRCTEAQIFLGVHCLEKNDIIGAFTYYLKAAKSGNMFAQKTIADMYYYGIGVERNVVEYFRWFKESANGGLEQGYLEMGSCFEGRIDEAPVGLDIDKAIIWYSKAKNTDSALFRLFCCFRVKKMHKKAIYYLKQYLDRFENNEENNEENNDETSWVTTEDNDDDLSVNTPSNELNFVEEHQELAEEQEQENEGQEETHDYTENNDCIDTDYSFAKYLYGLICYFSREDSKHYLGDHYLTVSNLQDIKSFKKCSECQNEILGFYDNCTFCSTYLCSNCTEHLCSGCDGSFSVSHLIWEYRHLFSYINEKYPRTKLRKYLKRCSNLAHGIDDM